MPTQLTPTQLTPQYLLNSTGEKAFVVLPIAEYEDLLEDLHDLAVMDARKDEPTVSLAEFEDQLRADGLLQD